MITRNTTYIHKQPNLSIFKIQGNGVFRNCLHFQLFILVAGQNTQTQNPQTQNTQIQNTQSPKTPKIGIAILIK